MENYNIRQRISILVVVIGCLSTPNLSFGQGMGVNATGAPADASAILDASSTSQGVLVPRMTQSQRDAISAPATGLLIYQTDGTAGFYVYSGAAWGAVSGGGSSAGWGLTGNAGTNASTDFIGITDDFALKFRVNNIKAGEINQSRSSIFFGENSGSNSTGYYSIGIGRAALRTSTANYNVAIGDSALTTNSSGGNCVAIGYKALLKSTYSYNTAIGSLSMMKTTGENNTAVGYASLFSNTDGSSNTALGYQALYKNNSGSSNVAIGQLALYNIVDGFGNVGVGSSALHACTSGIYNLAIGQSAALTITSGSSNACFGGGTGSGITTGSNNTAVGAATNFGSPGITNASAFGFNARSNASNQIVIGNGSVTQIGGYVSWSNLSDARFKSHIKEDVPGLDFVMKLRPVTYHFESRKFDQFQGITDSANKGRGQDYWKDAEGMVRTGFLAQEVEQAARQAGYEFSGLHKPVSDKDNYTLAYAEFTVPLVKAVQEQQKVIAGQQEKLDRQQKILDAVLKKLAELEQKK
jgi:trimeric autotransporter adhesin